MTKTHSIYLKIKAVLKANRPGVTASEVAEEIRLSIDAESPFGGGPTGIALRQFQPVCR
jgi:hypothetical protein